MSTPTDGLAAASKPRATGARRRWRRPFTYLAALALCAGILYLADRGPLWPGILSVALGQAVQLWAAGVLPCPKNSALVSAGPYACTRNPMYVGRFLVGLGLVLFTWRWYVVAGYVVLFALYAQLRVQREERRLRQAFGEGYDDYCRRVHRWLPTWPERGRLTGAWSAASTWRYGQAFVAIALVVVVATLVVRRVWE